MTCTDCGSSLDADEARDWLGLCPSCWVYVAWVFGWTEDCFAEARKTKGNS
jgi:NMD protein affecting ribosome stability and mRNA decay